MSAPCAGLQKSLMGQMDETNAVAREYLKAPYSRVLIPDEETGTYTAKIAEFPGCIAQGDSPEEAYRNLEAAAESWIEELLGASEDVPEPAVGVAGANAGKTMQPSRTGCS